MQNLRYFIEGDRPSQTVSFTEINLISLNLLNLLVLKVFKEWYFQWCL